MDNPKNPETPPGNTENSCHRCGANIKPVYVPFLRRHVIPACDCMVAEYEREETERKAREKQEHIDRILSSTGLGERFKACTFDNWIPRKGTSSAFNAAQKYAEFLAENLKSGRGYIMFGQPGNGKTHLAAAIVNVAARQGFTAIFERVPMLLAKIRATYNGGPVSEGQIMKTLTEADLLVLDDAGAEKCTQWTEPTLYTIIDERYSRQKSLLITTNSSLDELEEKIGVRAMDRVLEMCEIVENQGTSFRKERARERARKANMNTKGR